MNGPRSSRLRGKSEVWARENDEPGPYRRRTTERPDRGGGTRHSSIPADHFPAARFHAFSRILLRHGHQPVPGQFCVLELETQNDLWAPITYRDENNVRVTSGSYSCNARSDESFADLAFSRSIIDGAHLWRERRLVHVDFYISDMLRDAIKQAKLKNSTAFPREDGLRTVLGLQRHHLGLNGASRSAPVFS